MLLLKLNLQEYSQYSISVDESWYVILNLFAILVLEFSIKITNLERFFK